MAWYDEVDLNEGEQILGIGKDKNTFSIVGPNKVTDGTYFVRVVCQHPARACVIAKDYFYRWLWNEQGLGTYDSDDHWKLNSIPMQFTAQSIDTMNVGVLWEVTVRLVEYAQAINDPAFEGYLSGSATGGTIQTSQDINGIPIILQYKYPSDHPRRPDELLTCMGNFSADTSFVTLRLPLIRYMTYPLAGLALINFVNSSEWFGFAARSAKINNVVFRGLYTPTGRTGADLYKHYYLFEFEVICTWSTWDKLVEVIDPETGRPPVGLGTVDSLQEGCTYPGTRLVEVNEEYDFNLLWPQWSGISFQDMIDAEFPVGT